MRTSIKRNCQILVVGEEPAVCETILMMLKFEGHDAETVSDCETALTMLKLGRLDLIIIDRSMPGTNSIQLGACIKRRWPYQPIIMTSAFADEFNTGGKPCGSVDFVINKPFSLKDLREAISIVLAKMN